MPPNVSYTSHHSTVPNFQSCFFTDFDIKNQKCCTFQLYTTFPTRVITFAWLPTGHLLGLLVLWSSVKYLYVPSEIGLTPSFKSLNQPPWCHFALFSIGQMNSCLSQCFWIKMEIHQQEHVQLHAQQNAPEITVSSVESRGILHFKINIFSHVSTCILCNKVQNMAGRWE